MEPIQALNNRFKQEYPYDQQHPLGLRMRRVLSWFERALAEENDPDARFIFAWIAYNSAYGVDDTERVLQGLDRVHELERQRQFFDKIIALDTDRRLLRVLREEINQELHLILDNEYIFRAFWMYEHGQQRFEDWLDTLEAQHVRVARAFREADCSFIINIIFERLYILRNQILHGGATHGSRVNREQVEGGDAILISLMPVIADLMMDGRDIDWGPATYPVIVGG